MQIWVLVGDPVWLPGEDPVRDRVVLNVGRQLKEYVEPGGA